MPCRCKRRRRARHKRSHHGREQNHQALTGARFHRSRASFRRPSGGLFRSGLNTRTSPRFNARMTPIRAKICRGSPDRCPSYHLRYGERIDRPSDVSMAPSLLVEFGFEALRGPRFIVIRIAPWTRLSRAAAGAGAVALEWPVRMVLTNPAAILTNEAFYGLRPRAGAFLFTRPVVSPCAALFDQAHVQRRSY
jgi:hypothetical protein